MDTLTPRQSEILAFIREYLQTHGYSPSVRDVAVHFGLCINGAACHLVALQRKGAIVRGVSVARSIRVVNPLPNTIPVAEVESRSCDLAEVD